MTSRSILLNIFAIISLCASAEVIHLDGTQWLFSRIDRTTPISTATLDGASKTIDLGAPSKVSEVVITFDGDAVQWIKANAQVSDNGKQWTRVSSKDDIKCQANMVNDITTVGNTVGLTQVTGSTSALVSVQGSCRYVKVELERTMDNDKHDIEAPVATIDVNPMVDYNVIHDAATVACDDSAWEKVGVPHCYNESDSYLNGTTGERCWRGEVWYRKHLTIDKKNKGKHILLEFQSVNIGCTVYINGHAIKGNTAVTQPGPVTHVGSFLPFTVDITPYVNWGGDNVIAVNVSNKKDTFFTWPCFAENEGFGQAMGGITAPVLMHIKDDVHIPTNSYSPTGKWGTYYGTLSASKDKAVLRFMTAVDNDGDRMARVTLKTRLLDHRGKAVLAFEQTAIAPAHGSCTLDHTDSIKNPTLWYPVGGSGTPYLYKVEAKTYVDGKCTDVHTEQLGIRTITWDDDYCYVNGEKTILRGFGNRNIYPGLGSAVPTAFQWEEIARIARCGGNSLRVGHQPPFVETIEACDALGVLLFLNSGDGEWSLKNEPALTYKREYDRDAIIAFRNHPSILVWESNNGLAYDGVKYLPNYTQEEAEKWDFYAPRIVMNRDGYPREWDSSKRLMVGYTNRYEKVKGSPSINTEVYGTNWSGNPSWCIARHDYDNEKAFTRFYVQNYLDDLKNHACGWLHWMLSETYGEGYTIYLNGMRNQKSLGSCAMDGNRFPKLPYRVYENALWVSYDTKPGVALQSHWNYSGIQDVDAWSNCQQVELFIDGVSQGKVTPDANTKQCTWKGIEWRPAVITAVGLDENGREVCRDEIASAGKPHHIELTVDRWSDRPDGGNFTLRANASDAFTVTARIVDEQGRWCPRAENNITFEVEGEGVYKGSYNFYITPGKGLSYHAPGDHELQAEGGLMRVAVRTTFNPGNITVKATSPGLLPGECSTVSKTR